MNTALIYRDGEAVPAIQAAARPRLLRRPTPLALLLTNALMVLDAQGNVSLPASFDKNTLLLRGIDPALATSLMQAPRFTAGKHPVTLTVNGQRHGRVDVRFNGEGALCFDRTLLDAASLNVPSRLLGDSQCHDFLGTSPQTVIDRIRRTLPWH